MPKFAKSSPEQTAKFVDALPDDPRIQRKKMFGYEAAFVNGNFFVGMHEDNVALRLPDGLVSQLPAMKVAKPFDPMGGRPMKGWFVVPKTAKLAALLQAALELVAKLPAKKPKPKPKPKPKNR